MLARLVRHDRNKPYAVEIGGEKKWLCGCGLSENKPSCDGTHKTTRDEEDGKLYVYDKMGKRVAVQNRYD